MAGSTTWARATTRSRRARALFAIVAVGAAIGLTGCVTSALPQVGVTSPHFGSFPAGTADHHTYTFSACTVLGGNPVKVALTSFGPFGDVTDTATVTIHAPEGDTAADLHSGDILTSTNALSPTDCFTVEFDSPVFFSYPQCGDSLIDPCGPAYGKYVSYGGTYTVQW